MAAYIHEWLKEGKVEGIWKLYDVPMNEKVPSPRVALQGGGNTCFTEMTKYGKRAKEFSEARMQRHMHVVQTLIVRNPLQMVQILQN